METKTLRNIYWFLVGSFYFLWRRHILAGIVLKQLEATDSDKGCGWGWKWRHGAFFFISLKVLFYIIFGHFSTTVSKIRRSHLSDFQYMVMHMVSHGSLLTPPCRQPPPSTPSNFNGLLLLTPMQIFHCANFSPLVHKAFSEKLSPVKSLHSS